MFQVLPRLQAWHQGVGRTSGKWAGSRHECRANAALPDDLASEDLRVMRARKSARKAEEAAPDALKGWKQIADFLGQPVPVVQHWGRTGMPVRREGRNIVASPDELNRWLGRESGAPAPVHIATEVADLSADLKRGLAEIKKRQRFDYGCTTATLLTPLQARVKAPILRCNHIAHHASARSNCLE